jgi:hypothetical protein
VKYCAACESRNFKISIDSRESRYEISVCETDKKRVSLRTLSARLARSETREKRVSLRNLSARLVTSEPHYEISVCETRKKRVSLQNLSVRLSRSESHYKISVYKTGEKRVSILISTRESREILARILGLKSESRFSREFH